VRRAISLKAPGSGLRRPISEETKIERNTDSSGLKRVAHTAWWVGFEFVNAYSGKSSLASAKTAHHLSPAAEVITLVH
jgi:hypothetical protein